MASYNSLQPRNQTCSRTVRDIISRSFYDVLMSIIDGIAASTLGSILNYLLLGLAPQIDKFYLHSFEILLACTVVFPGVGNLGYTLLEYRLGQRNFIGALIENLRWIPFLYVSIFLVDELN